MTISNLLLIDGLAFILISIIVLISPSPQPTLTTPVDDRALVPFKDTRRLLASQFLGNGLLALLLATTSSELAQLRLAALVRAITLLVVIGVNLSQLRNRFWKPTPLYVLIGLFTLFVVGYLTLALTA